jgi:hypothetical protein
MHVEIAEERILLLPDAIGAEQARTLAWAKRSEAFGAVARIGGLISRPKDEDYEIVYSELRLQPFWRISASTTHIYERQRPHKLKVSNEVSSVAMGGQSFPAAKGQATITITEHCHEASQRDWLFDGLTKKADPDLKDFLATEPKPVILRMACPMTSRVSMDAFACGGSTTAPARVRSFSSSRVTGFGSVARKSLRSGSAFLVSPSNSQSRWLASWQCSVRVMVAWPLAAGKLWPPSATELTSFETFSLCGRWRS